MKNGKLDAASGTAQSPSANEIVILNLFALSGIAALIYQVCWQRLLFASFGVDIESVTIVVSVFMFGLGIGALIGGAVADRFADRILMFFVVSEYAIGVFGFFSPLFINMFADHFMMATPIGISAANFCLLLFPTVLMGATLPMLTVHLHKTIQHVGISIGKLYFVNTLGASVGSFCVGYVLFPLMTINSTIYLAACTNITVASVAVWKFKFGDRA